MHLDKHPHLIVGLVLKLGKISILIGDCYINNISHFILHVQVCKGLWPRSFGPHLPFVFSFFCVSFHYPKERVHDD